MKIPSDAKQIFLLELVISILSTFFLMGLTFLYSRSEGLVELINGYNDQFKTPNLMNLLILLFIGLITWIFYYFFNFKHKIFLKKLSVELFNICINLLRLASGIMFSFIILHLLVEGYSEKLPRIFLFGFLALVEVTCFSYFKDYYFFKEKSSYTPIKYRAS
ncbi:hypothetical protein [Acinetobacter sp. HR7]|uniref:hypothetical protein n=1 Tax=Acinetobacter sp. HR7 TaxID=1509403 RepID=UPI0005595002|nr:hypothetical protein [Acinetobacter sp. HR7]